jgi:hypothetical protein
VADGNCDVCGSVPGSGAVVVVVDGAVVVVGTVVVVVDDVVVVVEPVGGAPVVLWAADADS